MVAEVWFLGREGANRSSAVLGKATLINIGLHDYHINIIKNKLNITKHEQANETKPSVTLFVPCNHSLSSLKANSRIERKQNFSYNGFEGQPLL